MATIQERLNIQYPIIQGGMVWCSGWRLASAVSNAGGLGLLGAGSMHPETLELHIQRCKAATDKPFGVNVPLMYPEIEALMAIIIKEKVPIVFTSAGNPKTWTATLHEHGIIVGHVVSNTTFARKCDEAGVDIIVAEGMEAGGHNGREETSTLCLIPQVRAVTNKLLLAAGGISTRASYHAALALGADGVQMGTRFALSAESSAHPDFKAYCRNLTEGQTRLLLKQLSPTRLAKNPFSDRVAEAEAKGINLEDLKILQGKGRAKKGIFEGDLVEGMLEIGQTAGSIKHEETVATIFADLVS
ncbi:MAG: nitronate monooxygenase [Bacteroidales bacterium]|nr:nitronate monooxygenase [Bacteroidales bacterium]